MSEKIIKISDWFQRDSLALRSVRALRDTLEAQSDAFESLLNGMRSVLETEEVAMESPDEKALMDREENLEGSLPWNRTRPLPL